jgi:hypothetical protein
LLEARENLRKHAASLSTVNCDMERALLSKIKHQTMSLSHILRSLCFLILKHLKFSIIADLHRRIQKQYSCAMDWIAAAHKSFASFAPTLKRDLNVHMAPYAIDSIHIDDIMSISRSWLHAIQTAFKCLVRLPHDAWISVTNFFNSVAHSVMAGINFTFRIVKMGLWITSFTVIGLVVLGLCIQLSNYASRLHRERQQEAERQRLLEGHERQEAERMRRVEELREQCARQREETERKRAEEVERKKAEEEQLRRQRARAAEERIEREKENLRSCFHRWQAHAEIFFRNIPNERSFPEPKMGSCTECSAREGSEGISSSIKICLHNLEKLLRVPAGYNELLRRERIRWHPDRFSRANESVKGDMIRKATALSQMIGELFEKEKSRARG